METINQKAIDELISTAHSAGSPRDQVEGFLGRNYIPLKWQWRFHAAARECDKPDGPTEIGVGGARGPGKSFGVFAQVALDDCLRYDGLKFLFLRQTGKAARESFEDLIFKVLSGKVAYDYSPSNSILKVGKSRILLGGFANENDINKYIGIEYDGIAVEELNQLTEEKVKRLLGSMRTSRTDWRPRLYTSFNPGGIGNFFVKERFVTPWREGTESKTRFIGSTYLDNPYLNKEYIDYLEGLTGSLGKAWREGDWDLFEGQYFAEWSYNIHTCMPFAIPADWKKIICIDYGFAKPAAAYWCAISPDGLFYVYRELYETNLTYSALTDKIIAMTSDDEDIRYWVADPSIWSKKGDTELSGAEIMQQRYKEVKKDKVLMLLMGNNDRINGWQVIREYLKPIMKEGSKLARLQVFTTCSHLIETIPKLVYDNIRVEDCGTDGDDHGPDALRYGLMTKPTPAITNAQLRQKRFDKKMREKKNKNVGFKMTSY